MNSFPSLLVSLLVIAAFAPVAVATAPPALSQKVQPVKIPLLVLLLEYQNCKLSFTDQDWNRKAFSSPTKKEEDERFDLFGPSGGTLNEYYQEVTCGRFQFVPATEKAGTANDGVIRISLDEMHPGEDSLAVTLAARQALAHSAKHIHYASFDRDRDNTLGQMELALMIVSAGGTDDKTFSDNRTFYSNVNLGALRRRTFCVITERRDDFRNVYAKLTEAAGVAPKYTSFIAGVGTLVHELGHSFGNGTTPDLYFVGHLTAMSGGQKNTEEAKFPGTDLTYRRLVPCHYGAYAMVNNGFVKPLLLEKDGVYEINSASTGRYNVFKIPTANPQEYFLLENRQLEGFDRTLGIYLNKNPLKNAGIAIWHINEAVRTNDDKDNRRVAIVEADEGKLGRSAILTDKNNKAIDPFFSQAVNAEFSATSKPGNRDYSGNPQPWQITDISASGSVMTFKFTRLHRAGGLK